MLYAVALVVAAAVGPALHTNLTFPVFAYAIALVTQAVLAPSQLEFRFRGRAVLVRGRYGRVFEGDITGCHPLFAPRGDHGIALETSRGEFALVIRGLDEASAHEAARAIAALTRR